MDGTDSAEIVIVGGGPAGMLAGLLFARAGIETLVLEKHADFFRDFRGDTVHPSTMEILSELGMLDRFLQRPHHRLDKAEIDFNGRLLTIGDLSHLSTPAPFIAMMPQWDFLDFLRDEAAAFPKFRLRLVAEAGSLVEHAGRVTDVRLTTGGRIRAEKLVIMADGRDSLVRREGLLPLKDLSAPIDVLWFAVPKAGRGNALRGAVRGRRLLVQIDRGDYWQCAYVIAKDGAQGVISQGIERFRADISKTAPGLSGLDQALPSFAAVRVLSVSLDRLTRWHRPGLLAIGDAAHAMSPVGGIGINLAIQDAVCAANVLASPLKKLAQVDDLLELVEKRRLLPTRLVQAGQKAAHDLLLSPLVSGRREGRDAPLALRLLDRLPFLRRLPGRAIGLGIRREHVRSPLDP